MPETPPTDDHLVLYLTLAAEFGGTRFGPFEGTQTRLGSDRSRCHIVIPESLGVVKEHCCIQRRAPDDLVLAPLDPAGALYLWKRQEQSPIRVSAATSVRDGDSFALVSPDGPRFVIDLAPGLPMPSAVGARGKLARATLGRFAPFALCALIVLRVWHFFSPSRDVLTLTLDLPFEAWRRRDPHAVRDLLRKASGDRRLKLYPPVPGSVVLPLETTQEGAAILLKLLHSGELERLLAAPVRSLLRGDLTTPGRRGAPEATTALVRLLKSLFEDAELRSLLVGMGDEDVVDAVYWRASRDEVFDSVVQALQRRGLVNRRLFDELTRARPARVEEVWEVAGLWSITVDKVGAA
jgi:hypothetical protein